jgi:hypothetical protein
MTKESPYVIYEMKDYYKIKYHPLKRKKNNIELQFTIKYLDNVNDNSTLTTHIQNTPYEITWCGD